ncbi:hypothetical protein [Liquorilactobacillus capillatus]|uniref:ABC-2 type transporter domain-containing protein n=1 Tax=Liquorilactobacillus capillatus DSM 19910 TaxID=1423731 RepID=A0A0R1MCD9_9LACO|nr:hypothetical protein [Liquorilactobacillus capillatus]KRL02618.1 hypothetical protein FC81_GL000655 [Liquorilactobacillus capillatus DSM 19910]
MIKLIQLKQVLRNRRFFFFTILIPCFWYLFMLNLIKVDQHTAASLKYDWFLVACLMGITGNSIVTFSKRISSGSRFYLLKARLSHYSIWHFMTDQLITQLILNVMIMMIIITVGLVLGTLSLNTSLLVSLLLLNIFGIYYSIIGFVLGLTMESSALDAAGAPLMVIAALFFVPFNTFINNSFEHFVTIIQQLFPGYYLYSIGTHLIDHASIQLDLIRFFISFCLTIIPFIMILWFKLIKKVGNN